MPPIRQERRSGGAPGLWGRQSRARHVEAGRGGASQAQGTPRCGTRGLTHVPFPPQTLKNSKSLGSLDCEAEDEDEARAKTAASSPRAPHGPGGLAAPACGPWASQEGPGGGADPGDWDSAGEEGACPPGPGELDLEQIENN